TNEGGSQDLGASSVPRVDAAARRPELRSRGGTIRPRHRGVTTAASPLPRGRLVPQHHSRHHGPPLPRGHRGSHHHSRHRGPATGGGSTLPGPASLHPRRRPDRTAGDAPNGPPAPSDEPRRRQTNSDK